MRCTAPGNLENAFQTKRDRRRTGSKKMNGSVGGVQNGVIDHVNPPAVLAHASRVYDLEARSIDTELMMRVADEVAPGHLDFRIGINPSFVDGMDAFVRSDGNASRKPGDQVFTRKELSRMMKELLHKRQLMGR